MTRDAIPSCRSRFLRPSDAMRLFCSRFWLPSILHSLDFCRDTPLHDDAILLILWTRSSISSGSLYLPIDFFQCHLLLLVLRGICGVLPSSSSAYRSQAMFRSFVPCVCCSHIPYISLQWVTSAADTHLSEVTNCVFSFCKSYKETNVC